MDETGSYDEEVVEGRGRSAAKRAARAVEETARQLVGLSPAQFERLDLPEGITQEVELARDRRGGSAGKRQLKHLAALLRRDDRLRADLEAKLAGMAAAGRREARELHRLEELRERLCDPLRQTAALEEVAASLPGLEREKLAGLARSVQQSGDKRAYREIFRLLRQVASSGD